MNEHIPMRASMKNVLHTMLKESPMAQKQLLENKEKRERNTRLKEKFKANEEASVGKKVKAENEVKELRRKLNASENKNTELEKKVNNYEINVGNEVENLKAELEQERKKRLAAEQNSDEEKKKCTTLEKELNSSIKKPR